MSSVFTSQSPSFVAIGNAIVDMCFLVSYDDLAHMGLVKGSMTLICENQLNRLLGQFKEPLFISPGGSAANTVIGCASLGVHVGYIGRVAHDHFGDLFTDAMSAIGVSKIDRIISDQHATGRCMIFITPDGERTMATYLGVCPILDTSSAEEIWAANAQMLFIEGYLSAPDRAFQSVCRTANIALQNNCKVVLSLGSTSCIQHNFHHMKMLMVEYADVIVGTVEEGLAITQAQTIKEAIQCLQKYQCQGALTDGGNGAYIFDAHDVVHTPAPQIDQIVDTTGAGDQFAAGYCCGVLQGHNLETCGILGGQAAAKVLHKIGAHP